MFFLLVLRKENHKHQTNIYMPVNKYIKTCLLLLFCFQLNLVFSQETGFPFLRNYTPKEYSGAPQVFAYLQDKSTGILYFGDAVGINTYDGVKWRRIPMKTTVYSLSQYKNSTIFVASIDDFGYLQTLQNGKQDFKSIKHHITDTTIKIGTVWAVRNNDKEVLFITNQAIYKYLPELDSLTIIKSGKKEQISQGFYFHDEYYARVAKNGVMKIKDNKLIKALTNDFFKETGFFREVIMYNDSSIIIPTRNNGIFIYNVLTDSLMEEIKIQNQDFIPDNNIYCSYAFPNNWYAIGSRKKGLLLIDRQGKTLQQYNESTLLQSDGLYAVNTDVYQNMWFGLTNGITKTEHGQDFSYWNKNNGLKGIVEDIIRYKGKIYVATDQKVYYIDQNNNPQEIKDIPTGQNWVLREIYTPKGMLLMVGTQNGIYQIDDNNKVKVILKTNQSTILYQSKLHPERIFSRDGAFISLIYKNGEYKIEAKWKGLNEQIRDILEMPDGTLWLGTYSNGIIKVVPDYENPGNPKQIKTYGTNEGLKSLIESKPLIYNNEVLFNTLSGFFRYNAKNDNFEPFCEFGPTFCDTLNSVIFTQETKNRIYLITRIKNKQEIGYLQKNSNAEYKWVNMPFRRLPEIPSITSMYIDSFGLYWIGGSEGLFMYNEKNDTRNYKIEYKCLVRKVSIGKDSIIYYGYKPSDSTFSKVFTKEIQYKHNTIKFEFAAPFFDSEEKTLYSFKLEGFDENWSEWSTKSEKEYTKVREGNYTFMVKAKNIYDIESSLDTYKIKILPPWYRTMWAYIIYLILSVALIIIVIKLYTRRLIKQKEHLEQVVLERTQEIRLKNEELFQQKEEIHAQAEELLTLNEALKEQADVLEATNIELEKLSIVASETDNAIIIMDKDGNFEWMNQAFTKLYGYTFETFVVKFGKNLTNASNNPEIATLLKECIVEKKSISYETGSTAANGITYWVQTTITPILDSFGNISKLVAIDSDITVLKEAKEKIELQNEHIKASIRYAKTIQNAILPPQETISNYFENFILFRPKDIVSGDFYWHTSVIENGKSPDSIIHFFAVADCTGHGVPGAFMSMICSRLLSEAVNDKRIFDPKKILLEVDTKIKIQLRQDKDMNNDGMDICLIRVDNSYMKNENTSYPVSFCGAKRPLFHYISAIQNVEEIKPTKRSIGGSSVHKNVVEFENHDFTVHQKDIIYLSSDGYTDQNNTERKRLGTPALLEYIKTKGAEPLKEQKDFLIAVLENWMQGTEQRDDISMVAIKF